MLILIEGVDGSGKTTLANDLVAFLGGEENATILHRGVPTSHILDEYELPFLDYVPFESKSIICDRWHIGADVYGPIKRGDNGIDPVIYWHMDSYFISKGAHLVYTEMPLKELAARVINRGDAYIDPIEIPDIVAQYRRVIPRSRLPIFASVDGTHDPESIATLASATEISAAVTGAFRSYVGPRHPAHLFVGKSETPIAFMPYEGTKAYEYVKKYGVDNTFATGFIDCGEDLEKAWNIFFNPFVFTLDEEAEAACNSAGVPFIIAKDIMWKI